MDFSSIVESVAYHASKTPDKLCLIDHRNELSYSDAWKRISTCATTLRNSGLRESENYVAIENNQGIEFLIATLAVQLSGAIAVPVEKNASAERKINMAQVAKPSLYLGPKECVEFDDAQFMPLVEFAHPEQYTPWTGDFPQETAISEILFSTGTTGIPKGVILTHRNDVAMAYNVMTGLQMTPSTVELIPVPLNHSYGLRRSNANLMNGSTALISDGVLALKRVFNLMDKYGANAMALAPNMLRIIFKLSGERLADYASTLDYIQFSSAPLAEQDKAKVMELLPNTRLYNFYGSSEAGATCLYDFNAMANKPHCIGLPVGSSRFIVVDENRNPIESSPDNMGIIASTGDVVMSGYLKEPELTRASMENGFVFTKDLGYIDSEGYVYILGRVDDVINFGGIKVAPEEIEYVAASNPIVHDCACVAMSNETSGQIPVLCIELEDGMEFDAKEFQKFLVEHLGANERPQRVEIVSQIPRTYNGKIKRNELVAHLSTTDK